MFLLGGQHACMHRMGRLWWACDAGIARWDTDYKLIDMIVDAVMYYEALTWLRCSRLSE